MKLLHWILPLFICIFGSRYVYGQCPSGPEQCTCVMEQSVIRIYQCDDLGDIQSLPYLGESSEIIQVIQISSSIVHNIVNNSFIGLKTRTLDLRAIGIKNLEPKAFAGLEDYVENLYLVDNDIQTLPTNFFARMVHLRTVTLDRNSLSTLEQDQFMGLESVTHLGLQGNNIVSIDASAFNGLSNLKYLYLQYNQIQTLPPSVFDTLVNLQELNIMDNEISGLHPNILSKLPLLEHLLMSNNLIESLPEQLLDNNRVLRIIDFDNNVISSDLTNRHFVGPRDMELLDLSFNNIAYFHPSTFHNLKKLRLLYLNNNRIGTLAGSTFEGLDNIVELYLQQNNIKQLPTNSFIGMPNVKIVDLSRNEISRLEFGIFDPFGNLEKLDISRNEIEATEHGPFITLRSLEVLDVSWNKLGTVHRDWFSQDDWERASMPLKQLNLENNRIRHIDRETFWPLKNLEVLDISRNRLPVLNETIFRNLSQLQEIGIHGNPFKIIPQGLFSDLNGIKTLELSETCITEIVPNAFDGLTALEKLDLSGSFIDTIYPESFSGLSRISILTLSYNNISTLERPVFSSMADTLEQIQLDHNILTVIGLGESLEFATNLKVLDLSFNKLTSIVTVERLQQNNVFLKMQGNPIQCDCFSTWIASYSTLTDYEHVLCKSPETLEGTNAVCFPFPAQCANQPRSNMYVNYCQGLAGLLPPQNENSNHTEDTYNGKTKAEYNIYCVEPEISTTTARPDDTEDNEEEPLPVPLDIDVYVDLADHIVHIDWQFQNNSRILGYRVTYREFGDDNVRMEWLIVNVRRTTYNISNLSPDTNYVICVGIVLNDDSILTDSNSCKEISTFATTTESSSTGAPSSSSDDSFPIMPVIIACIAVIVVLVLILVCVIVCLKSKPKTKDEDKYMDQRLRDKMGMWVNSLNYTGGTNEQIAEQTTVEVDIFAPVAVDKKKSSNRESNGHVTS